MLELLARGALEADGRGRGEGPAEGSVPGEGMVVRRKIEVNPGPAFVDPP